MSTTLEKPVTARELIAEVRRIAETSTLLAVVAENVIRVIHDAGHAAFNLFYDEYGDPLDTPLLAENILHIRGMIHMLEGATESGKDTVLDIEEERL